VYSYQLTAPEKYLQQGNIIYLLGKTVL